MFEYTGQILETQTTATEVIEITASAISKVKELVTDEAKDNLHLRVYIVGGGCAGFQYGFAFTEQAEEDDTVVSKQGVKIAVDPMSLQYLSGATVDYVNDLKGAHFVVHNPNANTTCGCGSSFSI